MRNTWKVLLTSALVSAAFASYAQAPATAPAAPAAAKAAPAPAATPAAATMQTFVCKDGTSVSAASAKGTCAGHKGIDKDATAKLTTSPTPAATAPAAKPAAAPAAAATGAAAAGGPGQVWVNEETKVYHCQGDRYYGKTKNGKFMSAADAKAAGAHASKSSKNCT